MVLDRDSIQQSLAVIFDQTQLTTTNHRKNCVSLYKIHVRVSHTAKNSESGTSADLKFVGEQYFGDAFIDMINRILVVKKGTSTADRTVKFVGEYVKYVNEKAFEEKTKNSHSPSHIGTTDEDDDTLASRFVARLLTWLFQGLSAKNKIVRFRAVHIISEMISFLGEIDDDLYTALRSHLIERVSDRESLIRAHAVVGLSKLAGSEDLDDLESDEQTILDVLVDVLQFDPAAEVRRAALLHTPLTTFSLPSILARTRDTDPVTRKLLYTSALHAKITHPRQLTIAQREQVVKDGLGDREPGVRLAAGKLISQWFDIMSADGNNGKGNEPWTGDDAGIMCGLVNFLQIFDVIGLGETVAVDALLSIFTVRSDVLDAFIFKESYWTTLTPESALLARVFIEHCVENGADVRLEGAKLPVVTAVAFHVQEAYNKLLVILQEHGDLQHDDQEEQQDCFDEDFSKAEAVLGELLRIAARLDYSDEIGRRKVFVIVRDMLAHEQFPESLIEHCLDVLVRILPTEREVIRIIVEVILELRDDGSRVNDTKATLVDGGFGSSQDISTVRERSLRWVKERHDMTTDEAYRTDLIDIRSLNLCIGMLERVNGNFEDNSTLEGVLADLIVPAVKRKELVMREKGIVSLGLCCLISKSMALNSFQLFINQVQCSPDELKVKVLQVIFDLMIVYHREFFGRSEDVANRIVTFLLQMLETDVSNAAQAVICVGLTKLLVSGIVADPKVLIGLALAYVSPATTENVQVRQCLSYFFPVYCYSGVHNQILMQSIFMTVYDLVTRMHGESEEQDMIEPYQFGLLFVDWIDPRKATSFEQADVHSREVYMSLAVDILKALYDPDRSGADQKNLCQLLEHLYFPPDIQPLTLLKLHILISHLQDQCPLDKPAEKMMDRYAHKFNNLFAEDLERLDERDHSRFPEIQALYEFVGVAVPDGRNVGDDSEPTLSLCEGKDSQPRNDAQKLARSPKAKDLQDDVSDCSEDEVSRSSPVPRRSKRGAAATAQRTEPIRSKDAKVLSEEGKRLPSSRRGVSGKQRTL